MRKLDKKIFLNKTKLASMLDLREKGWTYTSLALLYGVDRSSIYYECKKFKTDKKEESVDFSIKNILKDLHIKVPEMKMYSDYLREAGYKPISHEIYAK